MIIDLQIAVEDFEHLPKTSNFQSWARAVFFELKQDDDVEITIRISSNKEVCQLNYDYRGKNKATNILSFPADKEAIVPADIELPDKQFIGDLIIAVDVMQAESYKQNKNLWDHYAHITIHGILHLLGYNHSTDYEAQIMEDLEVRILARLGIANPYN